MTVVGFGKEVTKLVKRLDNIKEQIQRMESHRAALSNDSAEGYSINVNTGYTAQAGINLGTLDQRGLVKIHEAIIVELRATATYIEERLEALMKGGYMDGNSN